jgi:hypothetical protein
MRKHPALLTAFLLFFFGKTLFAQTEVTVMVQITPPYSPYLSTYVDQPYKAKVTLINNTNRSQELKLWVRISGDNGVSLTTISDFTPQSSIKLDPIQGFSKTIYFNEDAAHGYFDAGHLNLTGITKSQLIQNQALPEGNYSVCAHAVDFATNAVKSMDGCTQLPIYYIDPPVPVQPTCGNSVPSTNPQFLMFTWTPPATAPGNIQYEFTLKEVPNNLNPNDVIKNQAFPVLYNTTQTANVTLAYTAAFPQLVAGKKYVWRVKAIDPNNGVQFKNAGYSQPCSFTWASQPQLNITDNGNNIVNTGNNAAPSIVPGSGTATLKPAAPIILKSPDNGSEIKWIPAAGNDYGHYDFIWQNVMEIGGNYSYHTHLVKLKAGQSPEDGIKNNPDMNQTDKGEPKAAPYQYHAKMEPGTYAWQVTTTEWDPKKQKQSDIWTFTVPSPETADFDEFTICGIKVHVTHFDSKDVDALKGTGYLYLWNGGPKVDVKFGPIEVRHCGLKGQKKIDWRVSKGYVGGDFKPAKTYKLTPKEGLEGTFELNMLSWSLQSEVKAYFDKDKGYYIIQQGDKGEGCKRNVWSEVKWTTPFSRTYEATYTGGMFGPVTLPVTEAVVVNLGPTNMYLPDPTEGAEGTANLKGEQPEMPNIFKAYGYFSVEKDVTINPDIPTNTTLVIEKGSSFNVVGNEIRAHLNGKFKIGDGNALWVFGKIIPTVLGYTYSNASNLLLKLTPDKDHLQLWNKNGSVYSELKGLEAWAVLGDQSPEGPLFMKGLLYPEMPVKVKLNSSNTATINFKDAINTGDGFWIWQDGVVSGDVKVNAFKSSVKSARMEMAKGKLMDLKIKGDVEIPFINAKAPFDLHANYDGVGDAYAYVSYDETTVFEKGADKVTCKPDKVTLSYDKAYLNGYFSFYNTEGKNVSAQDVYVRNLTISANGDVKHDLFDGFLPYEINATFNQFPYKVIFTSIKGTGSDKHYVFHMNGNLTLEENTLAPKTLFPVDISFYQPPTLPEEQLQPADKSLMASADPLMTAEPVTVAPTGNSLDVSSGSVCAAVSPNGLGAFDGCFKYFTENDAPYGPVYGSGFILTMDATFENPMTQTLSTKIMVGKKDGYRYWFVAASQQGFVEVPTGVLDIDINGFGGRIYYHMTHGAGNNINDDNYVPDGNWGFGLYGNATILTKGSNGKVLWGNLATEIQTTSSGGLYSIAFRGDAWLLSSGFGQTDAKVYAVADLAMHFQTPKYLEGNLTVTGNVLDLIEVGGTANLRFADNDWHVYVGTKAAPIYAYVYPIGKELNGYFTIQRANGQVTLGAGVAGEIYGFHIKQCKCLVWTGGCICKGCYGADFSVGGSLDAAATFPSFQLSGSFSLTGSAGINASLCGIGLSPSLSATFSGAFELPHPFCVAGGVNVHTPWPFPDFGFKARFKDGAFSKTDNCN